MGAFRLKSSNVSYQFLARNLAFNHVIVIRQTERKGDPFTLSNKKT